MGPPPPKRRRPRHLPHQNRSLSGQCRARQRRRARDRLAPSWARPQMPALPCRFRLAGSPSVAAQAAPAAKLPLPSPHLLPLLRLLLRLHLFWEAAPVLPPLVASRSPVAEAAPVAEHLSLGQLDPLRQAQKEMRGGGGGQDTQRQIERACRCVTVGLHSMIWCNWMLA